MIKHEIWTLVGFLIFVLGIIGILISMVGLDFTPFKLVDNLSRTAGFVLRVLMIFGGISLMFINRTKNRVE